MDEKAFRKLLNSTEVAKKILSKKATPSRTFYIDEPDAKLLKNANENNKSKGKFNEIKI